MNLRKALDKAQKERQDDILFVETSRSDNGNVPLGQKTKNEKAWQAPVYTKSTQVLFDQGALVENKCVCISSDAAEMAKYKVLRAQVMQKTKEKGWNTLMVTSAKPGEGKTLTSINLAITLAKEFHQTVLLVDCDFGKQDIHKRFGYPSDRGLADVLRNNCSLDEVISWPGVEKLTVISGGQTIESATELLGSPQMKSVVAEMKDRYPDRYVIFDLPSLLEGADAITCAPLVDGILIVTQAGRNSNKDINRTLELIPQEKLLGFVLNRET